MFPLDHIADVGVNPNRYRPTLSYSAVKLFSKYSNLCDHGAVSERHRQTDRLTDGRTEDIV